jgi:hypothetical protein
MAEMARTADLIIASGLVGYAITMKLLANLRTLGILSGDELLDIVDGALSNLEAVDAEQQHELQRLARNILGHHLASARNATDPELGPDVSDP